MKKKIALAASGVALIASVSLYADGFGFASGGSNMDGATSAVSFDDFKKKAENQRSTSSNAAHDPNSPSAFSGMPNLNQNSGRPDPIPEDLPPVGPGMKDVTYYGKFTRGTPPRAGDNKVLEVRCINGVLYYAGFRILALSYDIRTQKPFGCRQTIQGGRVIIKTHPL